jgi:3-oxoacyl-[acyl-carrier-protein] synthase-3
MLYKNVCIEAYGYELPEDIVSSEEVERRLRPVYDRLKLPYGRLELISGVKERRFWKNGIRPSQVSALAAEKAIRNSGISKKDIGCLIHASVCRDFLEPATASVVHHALELPPDSTVFDISNACLGFVNSIAVLANMIELGQIKAGLIVAGENGKQLVESTVKELLANTSLTRKQFKPYFASLTIGAGAVAVVLTHSSISKTGHRLLGGQVQASTEHNDLCTGGGKVAHDGHVIMQTDSEAVLTHGIELAQKTWKDFKNELGWENTTPDRIFCHQVGSAHRKMLYEALELDINKGFPTLEYLGNVGSASLPITMAVGIEKGLVEKDSKVAMLGIGSGLNCVMLGVEW